MVFEDKLFDSYIEKIPDDRPLLAKINLKNYITAFEGL
jgi:hypothetical protein